MRPEVSYIEPWQWQSQPPYSPSGAAGVETVGVQPRWVQTPLTTSHSALMTRLSSDAEAAASLLALRALPSGSDATSTARALLISSGVRRRTNSGWPRCLKITCWPDWMASIWISVVASARAAALGFICWISGQAVAAAATAPIAPDATRRKSRRVPASLVVAATGITLQN